MVGSALISGEEEAAAVVEPVVLYPGIGSAYPRIQPARQDELNQLNAIALTMIKTWIGDMLGAEKKGEMMERLK